MNVLYITNATTRTGGANKSLMLMIDGMQKRGIQCHILCPDQQGIYQDLQALGFHVLSMPFRPHTYPNLATCKDLLLYLPRLFARLLVNTYSVFRLVAYCKRADIQIIHTNVSVLKIGYQTARIAHIRHVWHVREYGDLDFDIHYFPTWRIYHKALRRSETIAITNSIQRHHNLTYHSHVIYNGIVSGTKTQEMTQPKGYLLYAARIEPAKSPDILIRAYAKACSIKEMPLLIMAGKACSEKYQKQMEELSEQLGITPYIHWLGERTDIQTLMSNAKAVVITSEQEAFGRTMPEAMSLHTLCIALDSAGTHEQLENGRIYTQGEIALRFTQEEQLVQCLIKSTDQKNDFTEMIARAYQCVKDLYSVEQYVQQTYNIYQND